MNLYQYATGQSLLEAGAISGSDMTVECAAIKLGYLMVYRYFLFFLMLFLHLSSFSFSSFFPSFFFVKYIF